MSKRRLLLSVASFFILVAISGLALAQSSREAEGKAAEQAGRLREALTHYVAALQSVSEGGADDQRLREAIIKLVQKLSPPPAMPEDAKRYSIRGQIAIKEAKSPADFEEAAKEFGKALRVAPWWADGYINHGVSLEKAGKYNEAIRSLKLYLLAAPGAPDAEKIKEQIYALEYRQERAGKEAISKKEEQERKSWRDGLEQLLTRMRGEWQRSVCLQYDLGQYLSRASRDIQEVSRGGCTADELRGSNWYGTGKQDFSLPGNGTVVIKNPGTFGWLAPGSRTPFYVSSIIGTPNGPRLSDIDWKCYMSNGEVRDAWSNVPTTRPDDSVYMTCDFGPSGGSDTGSRRYRYFYFKR